MDEEPDSAYLEYLNILGDYYEVVEPGEYYDDEEEDEDEEDDEEVQGIGVRVSGGGSLPPENANLEVEGERDERSAVEKRKALSNVGEEAGEGSSQGSQWNRAEIDGLFCPICMEPWTSDGDHHLWEIGCCLWCEEISCLPCGHLFGLSCITRWLKQRRSSAKCPQCNRKCALKDVRKLFASAIAVVDDESQKRIRLLETKCVFLERQGADWCMKESDWKKKEAELQHQVYQLTERTTHLERLLEDLQKRHSGLVTSGGDSHGQFVSGKSVNSYSCKYPSSCSSFCLQAELKVDGARLFDIDASGHMLFLSRRLPGMAGTHVLTKISLISPHEREDIYLPSSTKFVKDLHISPSDGSLALCASLGKKIMVLSTESKNVILSYDLPVAAWSCSWDLNSSYYIYAGLQNGSLLVFDIRQTMRPMESHLGLSTNAIHTIHSLRDNSTLPSGFRSVLSASSVGVCQWNCGGTEESTPYLVCETANQGVCISLAYCSSSDDIVASYRPRVDVSNDSTSSQPVLTSSPVVSGGIQGSHLHMKRVGSKYEKLGIACTTVSDVRLPKSAIVDRKNQTSLLATGDEATCGLVLKELTSFTIVERLKPHQHFICDVKYASVYSNCFLGCLSEDRLQIYTTTLS